MSFSVNLKNNGAKNQTVYCENYQNCIFSAKSTMLKICLITDIGYAYIIGLSLDCIISDLCPHTYFAILFNCTVSQYKSNHNTGQVYHIG